jgi:hypothetical protein
VLLFSYHTSGYFLPIEYNIVHVTEQFSSTSPNGNQAQNSERGNDTGNDGDDRNDRNDTFRNLLGPPPDRPPAFREDQEI